MSLEGYSRDGIAKKLNQEGILTPSEYKRKVQGLKYANALEKAGAKGWAYPTINVILRNRVYTGAMVQHKSEKISYKVEKYQYIPEEQQYIVEGMHEAIISKDTFEQVQELMKKRTRTPGFNSEVRKVNPYAGIIVCGDCGYNFQRVTCRDGYECGTYHKKGNTVCYSHFIKKEVLDSIVKNEIQRQAELALKESDKDEILKVADRKKEVQRRCAEADQQIERLQKELAAVQKYKKKTYENYVDGVLDKEEYLSYKAEYEKQDKDIRAKIQLAEQEKDSFGEAEESYENWIEKFIKYGTSYHHQNLRGYLLTIARNLCFNYFRDKKVTETSVGWEELDKIPKPGNQIKETEDIIYLQNLLKALSSDIREVVVLRMYEEMKFKDIADMMGCSVSTAKSRFRLGISQLKRMMEEEHDDGR